MDRRNLLLRAAAALTLTALPGLVAAGCGHSSGRQLPPTSTQTPNLVVDNRSHNSLAVYVDGGEIGKAPPAGEGRFHVLSGRRTVEVREQGHATRHSFGEVEFAFSTVELTYKP